MTKFSYHNTPLRALRPPESSASNHTWNYFESKYVTLLDYRYTIIYSFVLLFIQILHNNFTVLIFIFRNFLLFLKSRTPKEFDWIA